MSDKVHPQIGKSWRSLFFTILLIIFMILVPFAGHTGMLAAIGYVVKDWIWVPLFLYVFTQQLETAQRSFTDLRGFIKDNFIAVFVVLAGFGVFVVAIYKIVIEHKYMLNYEQTQILLQCTAWGSYDFFFGFVYSFVIAGSTKGREEEPVH